MARKQFTPDRYHSPLKAQPPGPKRAIIHPRVSTDANADDDHYSVPEQERKGREYCEAEGFSVVRVIPDDFTGRTLNRPGFREILQLARAREFEILVCVRTNRLARKGRLQGEAEELLAKHGVELRYVEQRFENNRSGRLHRGIQAVLDEHQWEELREITVEMRRAKVRGNEKRPPAAASGRAKYGYRQITVAEAKLIPEYEGRSGERVIVEEEAAIVRRIFELCAGGMSTRRIALWLRENGHRTRAGNIWSRQMVADLLRDEQYTGRLYWGRYLWTKNDDPAVDPETGKKEPNRTQEARPKEEQDLIPVPAIISRELFDLVQERLAENRDRRRGRPSQKWLLTGCLFCADCKNTDGRPVRWSAGATNPKLGAAGDRYACQSRIRFTETACWGIIPAAKLEAMALDALYRLADPDWYADFGRRHGLAKARAAGQPGKEADRARQALEALAVRERQVIRSIDLGASSGAVQAEFAAIRDERTQWERTLAEAEAAVNFPDPASYEAMCRQAAEDLGDALEALRELPEGEARIKLRDLFRRHLTIEVSRFKEPEIRPLVPRGVERWKAAIEEKMAGISRNSFHFEPAAVPLAA